MSHSIQSTHPHPHTHTHTPTKNETGFGSTSHVLVCGSDSTMVDHSTTDPENRGFESTQPLDTRGCIFRRVQPFYEQAVSNLDPIEIYA